jgi:hypothetical protein
MEVDDSGPRGMVTRAESLEVGTVNNQQEIIDNSKILLMLLKKFVSMLTSDANIHTEVQPEVSRADPCIGRISP